MAAATTHVPSSCYGLHEDVSRAGAHGWTILWTFYLGISCRYDVRSHRTSGSDEFITFKSEYRASSIHSQDVQHSARDWASGALMMVDEGYMDTEVYLYLLCIVTVLEG